MLCDWSFQAVYCKKTTSNKLIFFLFSRHLPYPSLHWLLVPPWTGWGSTMVQSPEMDNRVKNSASVKQFCPCSAASCCSDLAVAPEVLLASDDQYFYSQVCACNGGWQVGVGMLYVPYIDMWMCFHVCVVCLSWCIGISLAVSMFVWSLLVRGWMSLSAVIGTAMSSCQVGSSGYIHTCVCACVSVCHHAMSLQCHGTRIDRVAACVIKMYEGTPVPLSSSPFYPLSPSFSLFSWTKTQSVSLSVLTQMRL